MIGRAALAVCVTLASILASILASPAWAAPRPSRASKARASVVILQFRGPRAQTVRKAAVRGLGERVDLVPLHKASAAANKAGAPLTEPAGRVAAGRALDVCCFVAGRVVRKGRRYQATITLYGSIDDSGDDSGDGAELHSFTVTERRAARLPRAVERRIASELNAAIERAERARVRARAASAPQPATPRDTPGRAKPGPEHATPVAPDARGEVTTNPDVRDRFAQPRLRIVAQGRPFIRDFRYNDDIMQALRSYQVTAPALGVTAVLFAGRQGIASRVGVALTGEYAFALSSQNNDGDSFPTTAFELGFGALTRLSLGPFATAFTAGYGIHRFSIDDSDTGVDPEIPGVTYHYLRAGADLSYPIHSRMSMHGGLAWRHLLSTGELQSQSWFPRLTGAGIDTRLGVSFNVAGHLSAHLLADVRRYFFAMNPEVGDPFIAGGAVDQYMTLSLGLSWRQ